MSFRLRRKESVEEGLRRIACEELDLALAKIARGELARDVKVHEVRKHCKKLRGLLRLVRPAFQAHYAQENAWFRDAAGELAAVRDADILLKTFDRLLESFREEVDSETFAPLRAALEEHRRRAADQAGDLTARLERFAAKMAEARLRAETWTLDDSGFNALGPGLEQTYRRGRRTMKTAYADPSPENFHEWRKHVKYHWYHMRLLSGLWRQEMQVRRDAAEVLSDLLGDDHDLIVLSEKLLGGELEIDDGEAAAETLTALADRRRAALQATAYPLGLRLYAEKPSCFTRRLGQYWRAWRKHKAPAAIEEPV